MARYCEYCNEKLGFFQGGMLCDKCNNLYLKNKENRLKEHNSLIPEKYKEIDYIKGSNYFEGFLEENDSLSKYKKEVNDCKEEYIKRYGDWESIKNTLKGSQGSKLNENLYKILSDLLERKKAENHFTLNKTSDKDGYIIAIAINDIEKHQQKTFYVWIENDELIFLDKYVYGIKLFKIPLNNILSFSRYGDFYTETSISGGDGGGSSLTGAVIGGVIAGGAGAVIGSRRKINEIKTENKLIDERQTILELDINSNKEYMFFCTEAYNVFMDLIPSKEISFVNKEAKQSNTYNDSNDIYNKIRQIAQLKDDGILTEEEFNNKKKELLKSL